MVLGSQKVRSLLGALVFLSAQNLGAATGPVVFGVAVADLPPVCKVNRPYYVNDGLTHADCSAGGGSLHNVCICTTQDPAAYTAISSSVGAVMEASGNLSSGRVPRADSAGDLLDGSLYDDGTDIGLGTASPALANGTSTNILEVEGATNPAIALDNTTASQQWAMYVNSSGDFIAFDSTGNTNRVNISTAGVITLTTTGTLRIDLGTCQIHEGSGAPEGAVAAPVCSTFHRTDGGAGTTFCVKESGGSGNTGWACK